MPPGCPWPASRDIAGRRHHRARRGSSLLALWLFCSGCPIAGRLSLLHEVRPFSTSPYSRPSAARARQAAKAGDEAVSGGDYNASELRLELFPTEINYLRYG